MSVYIVKAKKTYLKSPLSTSAGSVVLRYLKDSKDNNLALANFGAWGVIVIKQGDTIEMIKFDGVSINGTTGVATLTVATNGRNIDPTYPYAGSSTGQSFQSGAEVIVTNDPLTIMQFGSLRNANTWDLQQTFTVAPKASSDATSGDELVRKSQLDSAVLGALTITPVVVEAVGGEALDADTLVYQKDSDGEWYKADADTASTVENVRLGITRGAGTDGGAITNGVTVLGTHEAGSAIFTANTPYFASNTAGEFSTTAGTKEVSVGYAISTTKIFFMPRYNQQITEDQQDALAGNGTPSANDLFVTQTGLQAGEETYGADTVGTDAYAIDPTPEITAYTAGMKFLIKIGTANTGACTLAVGSGGAKAIKKQYNQDLVTGDILEGQVIEVAYDDDNDCWQMISPTNIGASISQISDPTRALGTDYQNTTGKNLFVMVTVKVNRGTSASANNFGRATAYMDTNSTPTTVVGWVEQIQPQTGANNEDYQAPTMMLTFVVPTGSYYRVVSSGTGSGSGATLQEWTEQTL